MSQLHKRFTSDQVKELLERYLRREIERKHLQEILGIKERRFFALVRQYRENPQRFTIQYHRASPPRISNAREKNVKVIHSLSPQARGKVERPYGWLQDRLIRTCVREDVTDIHQTQRVKNSGLKGMHF